MRFLRSIFAISLFATLASCIATTSNVEDNGKGVTGVEVSPNKETLTTGTTLQFEAILQYADGTNRNVTNDSDTVWNTNDPTLATVSNTGLVTAIKIGLVDISANFKGEKGEEHFTVTP